MSANERCPSSGVTTTSSPLSMFTEKSRNSGDDWHDVALAEGRSERFIHITGDTFHRYGDMWIAKHNGLVPASQSEARDWFQLPGQNPASHLHIFDFVIPKGFAGLVQPVVLLASKERTTKVWQAKIQDQLVPFIRLIETIPLK